MEHPPTGLPQFSRPVGLTSPRASPARRRVSAFTGRVQPFEGVLSLEMPGLEPRTSRSLELSYLMLPPPAAGSSNSSSDVPSPLPSVPVEPTGRRTGDASTERPAFRPETARSPAALSQGSSPPRETTSGGPEPPSEPTGESPQDGTPLPGGPFGGVSAEGYEDLLTELTTTTSAEAPAGESLRTFVERVTEMNVQTQSESEHSPAEVRTERADADSADDGSSDTPPRDRTAASPSERSAVDGTESPAAMRHAELPSTDPASETTHSTVMSNETSSDRKEQGGQTRLPSPSPSPSGDFPDGERTVLAANNAPKRQTTAQQTRFESPQMTLHRPTGREDENDTAATGSGKTAAAENAASQRDERPADERSPTTPAASPTPVEPDADSFASPRGVELDRMTDRIYHALERKMRVERERRGF